MVTDKPRSYPLAPPPTHPPRTRPASPAPARRLRLAPRNARHAPARAAGTAAGCRPGRAICACTSLDTAIAGPAPGTADRSCMPYPDRHARSSSRTGQSERRHQLTDSFGAPQWGQPRDWRDRGMGKGLVSERDSNPHGCDLRRCSPAPYRQADNRRSESCACVRGPRPTNCAR
jgi:hypothetical protein